MTDASRELPEAAERRLSGGGFSSGLSVPEFAACVAMGAQPVGFVQGFCAMQWSSWAMSGYGRRGLSPFGGAPGGYMEMYQCPHGMVGGDHRVWGQNYQQTWVEDAWNEGYSGAYARMVDEAADLRAHGIIGVVDRVAQLSDTGVMQFHLCGTAIRIPGLPDPPSGPFTTFLAGQRLVKVFEAGFVPVAIVCAMASVRMWAYCMTEYLLEGVGMSMMQSVTSPVEIEQVVRARTAARSIARARARAEVHSDALHAVEATLYESEHGRGDLEIQCWLRGNRIRRFRDSGPLPVPQPTVRLT